MGKKKLSASIHKVFSIQNVQRTLLSQSNNEEKMASEGPTQVVKFLNNLEFMQGHEEPLSDA